MKLEIKPRKVPDRAFCPFRLGGFFALSVNDWEKKDSDSTFLDEKTKCENSYYCLGKKCRLWNKKTEDCFLCKE
jgi:hypothetical protein